MNELHKLTNEANAIARGIKSRVEARKAQTKFDLALNFEEACLVRDALIEIKHQLRKSTSERGQKLCRLAEAMHDELSVKIHNSH
jgi:hypothetical protein